MMKSLQGLRILNTRPKEQAKALTETIQAHNGISIECPLIEIKAVKNQWIQSVANLSRYSKAIFVSANAVHFFFKELNKNNITWPDTIHVIAIGNSSAHLLESYGIRVHEIPKEPDSEHLLALPSLKELEHQTVLLVKGVGGRPLIEESLRRRLAHLMPLLVYQRVFPDLDPKWLQTIWRNDLVDIILITSLESLHNLFKLFGASAHSWLQSKPCLVISKRLMQEASLLDVKNIIISHPEKIMRSLLEINV